MENYIDFIDDECDDCWEGKSTWANILENGIGDAKFRCKKCDRILCHSCAEEHKCQWEKLDRGWDAETLALMIDRENCSRHPRYKGFVSPGRPGVCNGHINARCVGCWEVYIRSLYLLIDKKARQLEIEKEIGFELQEKPEKGE